MQSLPDGVKIESIERFLCVVVGNVLSIGIVEEKSLWAGGTFTNFLSAQGRNQDGGFFSAMCVPVNGKR